MKKHFEVAVGLPEPVDPKGFNRRAILPYGLKPLHVRKAMDEFVDFLGFINQQLTARDMLQLEAMLMPANFSSIVGEFMGTAIPRFCRSLVKNQYHNGHPDLIPANQFPGNAAQHSDRGVEIKASRYPSGWQGHNPEDTWLLVFVFSSDRPRDAALGSPPRPFRFEQVLAAQLQQADWSFSGRADGSRRTITASLTASGFEKMAANWVYRATGSR